MSEARVFADDFQRTFAQEGDLMRFLEDRAKHSLWIRKPTKDLRLMPVDHEKVPAGMDEELKEDTRQHTQLILRMKDEYYPVRSCAIQTILKRAGISGSGLNRLETPKYAKVLNMCLQKAKGEALIRIADGKVSAAHGGDYCDYKILDTEAIFQETLHYLDKEFPGYSYYPGSGSFDHSLVTAMWELNGQPELLGSYQEALEEHGIDMQIYAPAVQELLAGLSYEQARAVVIDGNGIHAGKTMGQVAMEKPDTLNWYVNKYGGPNNLLRAAAQVLLTKAAA